MTNEKRKDKLMEIDFNSAFPETPSSLHEAILLAQKDIRRHEARRRAHRKLYLCAAAAAAVVIAVLTMVFPIGKGSSDVVTPPALSANEAALASDQPVYSSKADPYYHLDPQCSAIDEYAVEIPLITAQEFEKDPCPECAGANG